MNLIGLRDQEQSSERIYISVKAHKEDKEKVRWCNGVKERSKLYSRYPGFDCSL